MAKEFVMPEGAKVAERTATNWGTGGSSNLVEGREYCFPTSKTKFDFINHDTWTSIVLSDEAELALSTVCRSRIGTPLKGGQPTSYCCDGPVTAVIKEVAIAGGDLNALLFALHKKGTGLKVTHITEFIAMWNNQPQLKRVYTLEFWGNPLASDATTQVTAGQPA